MSDMCHNNIKMYIPIHFRCICTMVRSGTKRNVVTYIILYLLKENFYNRIIDIGEQNCYSYKSFVINNSYVIKLLLRMVNCLTKKYLCSRNIGCK